MDKKTCWIIIFLTMALNVVMLHSTIEAYYGNEYEHVYIFTGIAMVSILIALGTFLSWRKLEYKQ